MTWAPGIPWRCDCLEWAEAFRVRSHEFGAPKADAAGAGSRGCFGQELKDGHRGNRFARSGLTNQSDSLPGAMSNEICFSASTTVSPWNETDRSRTLRRDGTSTGAVGELIDSAPAFTV